MANYKIILQYEGTRYQGWQKQGNTDNTVQAKLEAVLSKMTGQKIEVDASGRTDAGVHALGQVANFHINTETNGADGGESPANKKKSAGEIMEYMNFYLPEDIAVISIKEAPERFHSRLWAREKTYAYWIDTAGKSPVFQRKYIYTLGERLDVEAMRQAAGVLCGTHDFGSFCTGKSKKKSTVRTISSLDIIPHGTLLEIRVTGDGFLHNMVRILTGTLIEVGQGKRESGSMEGLLEESNRREAGFTAPAKGLFLMKVVYDQEIFCHGEEEGSGDDRAFGETVYKGS